MPDDGAAYTMLERPIHPSRTEFTLLEEELENSGVLAAIFERQDEVNEQLVADSVFWLPDIARSALADWVRAAFARWRDIDPDTFPISAEWRRSDQWSSPEELAARNTLATFDAEEEHRRAEAAEKRRGLARAVESAEADGESWRALISDTGHDLVASVMDTLELIGFNVVDADSLPGHKGKKREDLRVTHDGWTALVEVKGYSGAAKSNDLQQIAAASSAYAAANGAQPDALWYVVNAHREADPAQRETPLSSREEDLESFAEFSFGTLLDTRELFRLRQLVVMGEISAELARERLMSAGARFVARLES